MPSAALLSKPLVIGFLVVVSSLALFYSLPGVPETHRETVGRYLGQVLVVGVALMGLLHRARRIRHPEERRFWYLVAGGIAADLCAWVIFLPHWGNELATPLRLTEDLLYLTSYGLMFLAIAANPHARPGWSAGNQRHRIESVCSVVLVAGFFIYSSVIAGLLALDEFQSYLPSALGYPILAGLLCFTFLYSRRGCGSARWRSTYGILAAAAFCWAALDTVEALVYAGLLPARLLDGGTLWNLPWYVPYFFIVLAAAQRDVSLPLAAPSVTASDAAGSDLTRLGFRLPLVLYPIVIPTMHFSGYWLGALDPVARPTREVCVFAFLIGLSGLAALHQRYVENERRALQVRIRQAEKLETVGKLAGGVAHDFNNLLTAISGNAEMALADLSEDDPARSYVEEIIQATHRAAWISSQLLSFSRPDEGVIATFGIDELVGDTLAVLRRLIREDIEVKFSPAAAGWQVHADRGQLVQLVMNLTINAEQAMPEGGELAIATVPTRLDSDPTRSQPGAGAADHVLLTVTDTGAGMDRQTLAKLFDPFFTTRRAGGGSGLGLSVVLDIVKRHRGRIEVRSELGRGTTFSIHLPSTCAMAADRVDPPTVSPDADLEAKALVLLVEDDEAVRNFVLRALRARGYQVLTAASAESAKRLLESNSEPVDLLLTDVVLPGDSGPDLYENLLQRHPDLRVLFMSGYQAFPVPQGAHVLEKPFTTASLAAELRGALGPRGV